MADPAPDPTPLELLQLLADPVRWALLQELARSDRRVHELTVAAGKPQNLVSYHLRTLRDAGLVSARRSSADGRDTYYRIDLERCGRLMGAAAASLHPGLALAAPPPALAPPVARGKAPRVLFLCTGNSARSQMAEALLHARSGHAVDARSAGSHPKVLHPEAVRVMAERGIDISGRPTKHLRRFARTGFDQVITLCDRVREVCPEFPRRPVLAHWSMPDPSLDAGPDEPPAAAFERTAAELETRIEHLLPLLIATVPRKEPAHV